MPTSLERRIATQLGKAPSTFGKRRAEPLWMFAPLLLANHLATREARRSLHALQMERVTADEPPRLRPKQTPYGQPQNSRSHRPCVLRFRYSFYVWADFYQDI